LTDWFISPIKERDMHQSEDRKVLPIIMSIFNQKGGVGKTTSTYEIGYVLYKMGLKVLMVDADPQSSLTTIINPKCSSDKETAEKFSSDLLEKKTKEGKFSRIDDIFEPALGLLRQDPVPKERAAHVVPLPVHNYGEENCKEQKEGLYYLPGSIKLDRLNKLITLGISNVPGTQAYANMVPELIREIGILNGFDIILIDLNPGIFALNESIIMKSDYLLMPFKPSLGCMDSVKNLIEVFPSWFDELRRSGHLTEKEGPLLLGTFPQVIRTRRDTKTKKEYLEISYENWIDEIFEKSSELVDVFINKMANTQTKISFKDYKDRIGVRDMVGAGLQAQTSGHPLSDIAYKHKQLNKKKKEVAFPERWNIVKKKTNQSYRKILGVFLRYLREEHQQALTQKIPNFMQTLNLYSTLFEEMERESEQIAETATQSLAKEKEGPRKRKRSEADNNYWYTNENITTLLRNILRDKPNYYFTTPMQGDGRFSHEQLTENIRQYVLQHIANEYNPLQEQTIFIPLNVGALPLSSNESGNHWTLAIVRISANQSDIFYFDPLGNDIPKTVDDALKAVANEVYHKRIVRIDRLEGIRRVQFDGYNCGPWIVEFVHQYSNNNGIANLHNTNISERRAVYHGILQAPQEEEVQQEQPKKKRQRTNKQSAPEASSQASMPTTAPVAGSQSNVDTRHGFFYSPPLPAPAPRHSPTSTPAGTFTPAQQRDTQHSSRR
jgi:chromosome partitioning protein